MNPMTNPTNMKLSSIDIEELNSYFVSNLDSKSNTITIVNFIIGSYVNPSDFHNPNPNYKRNHEFPEFVKKLLYNPELQFSPEFNSSLSSHKELIINQVLILADPAYSYHPELTGFFSETMSLSPDLTITNVIEHNEFIKTKVTSKLETVVIPCEILEEQVESLLKIINSLRQFYSIIVNIMDCSSRVLNKMFIDRICDFNSNNSNYESWIYLTKPECLIIDNKLQYNPIITIDNAFESHFAYKKIFNIRWCNYRDDLKILDDLKTVYEFCPYSRNTYNFITTLYKVDTIEYSLYSIFKLWGFTTYTIDYQFKGFDIHTKNDKLFTVNFSKITFEDFARYWKLYEGFRSLPLFYDYNIFMVKKFIEYFINKYTYRTGVSYLGINPSIVDFLKIEAFEIFDNLKRYFKKVFVDNVDADADADGSNGADGADGAIGSDVLGISYRGRNCIENKDLPINPEFLEKNLIKSYLVNNGITF